MGEFSADMDGAFPPGLEHDANGYAGICASYDTPRPLKCRNKEFEDIDTKINGAKKAQKRQQPKCPAGRKVLVTGLALLAMATIIIRPKLPPR